MKIWIVVLYLHLYGAPPQQVELMEPTFDSAKNCAEHVKYLAHIWNTKNRTRYMVGYGCRPDKTREDT